MLELLTAILIAAGVVFFAAGSVGLLRLPDLHSRLHSLTKADNVGLGFIAAGVAIIDGNVLTAIKLFLIWLLVISASATSSHLIARHALQNEDGRAR